MTNLFIAIGAGVAFAYWQHSEAAGWFVFCVMCALPTEPIDVRVRMRRPDKTDDVE